jgi:hypothetical protein
MKSVKFIKCPGRDFAVLVRVHDRDDGTHEDIWVSTFGCTNEAEARWEAIWSFTASPCNRDREDDLEIIEIEEFDSQAPETSPDS